VLMPSGGNVGCWYCFTALALAEEGSKVSERARGSGVRTRLRGRVGGVGGRAAGRARGLPLAPPADEGQSGRDKCAQRWGGGMYYHKFD